MGNFEERDRDNKSENPGRQGQGQKKQDDRNKQGQQNEPGREGNPREGQGTGSQRQGGTSPSGSREGSENDEESA